MSKDQAITLQPLAMRIPNEQGIYQPSKLRPQITLTYNEHTDKVNKIAEFFYLYTPIKMLVNLDPDATCETLVQDAIEIKAYGFGFDCWYMVTQ